MKIVSPGAPPYQRTGTMRSGIEDVTFSQVRIGSLPLGEVAGALRAMANEARLLVLYNLADSGELPVRELVERVGLSQSALSQHLAKLRKERLVVTRKEAQTIFYRLSDPRAARLLSCLRVLFNLEDTPEAMI